MSFIARETLVTLVLATGVAPIAGSFLGMLVFAVTAALTGHGDLSGAFGLALFSALYVGIVLGIPATVIMGLPVHAALLKFDLRLGWHYAFAGAPLGMAAASLVMFLFSDGPTEFAMSAPLLALGALIGAATAWVFWFIRQPDHDAPNPPGVS